MTRTDWFVADRFGLFIHWGLYAVPGRHEWVKSREQRTTEDYDRYLEFFDPDLYDPKQWARDAKNAGTHSQKSPENEISKGDVNCARCQIDHGIGRYRKHTHRRDRERAVFGDQTIDAIQAPAGEPDDVFPA